MTTCWDEQAWRALHDELEAWRAGGARATLWWRDDDAGSLHPGLGRLLSLARRLDVPVALAVVPAWLTPALVEALRPAAPGVVVLQHGAAHVNHEREIPAGESKIRPAECGVARDPGVVVVELLAARARLRADLAGRLLPVFVPPWNRIAPAIVAALPGAGYRGVSTFRPRGAATPVPGLRQTNCHADPILWRDGRRFAGAATLRALQAHLAARREQRVDPAEATGLLTHHRDIDEAGWGFLERLLDRLRVHPAVAFPPLASLLVSAAIEPRADAGRPPG